MNALPTWEIVPELHRRRDQRVAVLGLGYVGLPTALALQLTAHDVIGIDISEERLGRIRSQAVDLVAQDRARLAEALSSDAFSLTSRMEAMESADVVVVCVPTPLDDHLLPDLTLLEAACRRVVRHARVGQLIVLTSTTYAGSTEDLLVEPLRARGFAIGDDINVAFSPERINPGADDYAQSQVPRVVGGATPACRDRAGRVLGAIAAKMHPVANLRTAELSKLYENTFRAVNVALANEFASVCRELNADVTDVIDAAATKPFGFMRFNPGPGVGGHCIPCDPHYLLWQLRSMRLHMPVVEAAMKNIEQRPLEVVDRVRELLAGRGVRLTSARVLVVGVAYKPDIEDVRESPAIEIVGRLHRLGAEVTVTDPHVQTLSLSDGLVMTCQDLAKVDVAAYDLVLLHTRHAADDLDRLAGARCVLDASYQLRHLAQAVAL